MDECTAYGLMIDALARLAMLIGVNMSDMIWGWRLATEWLIAKCAIFA